MKAKILSVILSLLFLLSATACSCSCNCNDNCICSTTTNESEHSNTVENVTDAEKPTSTKMFNRPGTTDLYSTEEPKVVSNQEFEGIAMSLLAYFNVPSQESQVPYSSMTANIGISQFTTISDTRAYSAYVTDDGYEAYLFYEKFGNDENFLWMYRNSIIRIKKLTYADFGDLEGKTAQDVEMIDPIVPYYKLAYDGTHETIWESRHCLEDGLLIIRYNRSDGKICEVLFNEDFLFERSNYTYYSKIP